MADKMQTEAQAATCAEARAAARVEARTAREPHAACGETTDEATVDLAELMDLRARTYGMLARLYRKEVDKEVLDELQSMRFPTSTGNAKVDEGYHLLYDYLRTAWDDSVTELAIDYVRTFIGHGVNGYSAAYPYESVYTSERRLMMQEARAEVLQTLRENNLKRGNWTEGEDHVALELEFMQRMAMRTAAALRDGNEESAAEYVLTQRTFARDHLLNWLPMLTGDMRMFSRTTFYQGLAQLTMGYVEEDEAVLSELLDG
ncbi:Chaperone protein TorD [Coriobacteriaceae bacterium CHKCI002]|nr:molecular chaperone TorD family protein [Rubneribacter badeniensis]CVH79630.1 Chaperone protein TorD [Coriobacteriaceae bacterium CHKCI002]